MSHYLQAMPASPPACTESENDTNESRLKSLLIKLQSIDPPTADDDLTTSCSEAGGNLWRALESSMVTLLTLTPGILDEVSSAKQSPSAASMLISVMSASSLLSSVTRTLIASVTEYANKSHHKKMTTTTTSTGNGNHCQHQHRHRHHHPPPPPPHQFRPVNNNYSSSAPPVGVHKKSDFALRKREQQVAFSVANVIRIETEYILDQVQAIRELVVQPQIFANASQSFDQYRQSIIHSLITHAHSLVDALLAFSASTSLVLVDKHLAHFASSLSMTSSLRRHQRKTPGPERRDSQKEQQQKQGLPLRITKEPVSIYPAMPSFVPDRSLSDHVRHPLSTQSKNEGDTKLEPASKKFLREISIKGQQPTTFTGSTTSTRHMPDTMPDIFHTSQEACSLQQQPIDWSATMGKSQKRSKAKQTNAFKTFFARKPNQQKGKQPSSSRIKELFTLPMSTSSTSLHADLKKNMKRTRAGSTGSSSQSLYPSETGSVWRWQGELEIEDCISYHEEEADQTEENTQKWAKVNDEQDERSQRLQDGADRPLTSDRSFRSRQQQRASVQTLASPFSRQTYIRMTDEGLSRFAVSLPEHEDIVCPMTLTRTSGYAAARQTMDNDSGEEDLDEERLHKSEVSTSDSCYYSSSSSQSTLAPESPVHPFDTNNGFLKPPTRMQTVQEEESERGIPLLKSGGGRPAFAEEKEGLKHFRSESDLSRLQQQTRRSANKDEKPKHSFKLPKPNKAKPPQRRHSVRSQLSIASRRSGGGGGGGGGRNSDTRSIKEPGEQGSWSLLRAMRRNQSSANLKKEADGRDMLRKAGLESSIVTRESDEESLHGDTRILHVSENGCDVMVMEMVSGRLHVVAGTTEKLFLKLADETTQDLDFVDTYILCHVQFTTSMALLEDLMARFHLEAGPGETAYFEKWQHSIQVKVLRVLTRWVKLQYQDFDDAPILLGRLEAFLDGDIRRAGFDSEADMIREALDLQMAKHARRRHSLVALTSHVVVVPSSSSTPPPVGPGSLMSPATPSSSSLASPPMFQRRPSGAPSLFSFVSSLSTPPSSPTSSNMSLTPASSYGSLSSATTPVVLMFEAKEIARYLTLADFYIFKCITSYDYLQGRWRQDAPPSPQEHDYIAMMTQRANQVSHWIVHEILSLKQLKQRRNALRKLIEVSKLCLDWNNFHTSMVITMSLGSAMLQKLEDTWQALSSKDMSTFQMLQKNLDVSNNMGAYRQAFASKAKAPAIPFFPLVLKDLTFYMDGNPTAVCETDMINFSKFRSLTKFVQSVLRNTDENYWFASDLDHLPFFPGHDNPHAAGPLDGAADVIENRLRSVACCHLDPQCESRLYNGLL